MGGISGALTVGRALFLGEAAVDVDLRFGSCQRAHIEGRPLKNTLRFPVHFYFPQNRDEPTLYRSYSFVAYTAVCTPPEMSSCSMDSTVLVMDAGVGELAE